MINIPQANPLAENLELADEITTAVQHVLMDGHYILGPETGAFEKEFAEYIGVPHGIGVASGTDAIRLGLWALGIGPGHEVITVSHTAVATVAAIEQTGAIPIFVDIDPELFTMDPTRLKPAISSRTRVIIPVHLYGQPAEMEAISAIADEHGIDILEDCAQAHGALHHDRKAGSWGRLAAFSFYPTKNLGAIGDGGMILTRDEVLAERLKLLREYGWKKRYISEIAGWNSRLDELQAGILRVKLRHLDRFNEARRQLARVFTDLLLDVVQTPREAVGSRHVYHLYVIRTAQRNELREYLSDCGIGTGIHYPYPVHSQPAYAHVSKRSGPLPVTEEIAREIISLPLYPQMSVEQVNVVASAIKDFFHVRSK